MSTASNGNRLLQIALVALIAAGAPLGLAIIQLTWWSAWSWAGVALMSFSPMLAVWLYRRLFSTTPMRPAVERYHRRLTATMIVYVAALMAATHLYDLGLTTGPIGYLVALAPAAPIVAIFLIIGQFLREETDEVMGQLIRTALLWSGALTLCEATVWGFLETFDKVPNIWMWVAPVVFFAQLGVTLPLAARRYR
ncbi:hypothetical protein [Phenylobacterium sp.]|uniref:hypothetical protein n=1 Tax=Phenylobacterium sp. TaxID=1871053 RepID=UPI0037CB800B